MSLISFDDPVTIKYYRHGQKSQPITAICLPDTDPVVAKAIRHYETVQAKNAVQNASPKQRKELHLALLEARLKMFAAICTDMPDVGVDGEDGKRVPVSTVQHWHERIPKFDRDQVVMIYLSRTVVDEGAAGN